MTEVQNIYLNIVKRELGRLLSWQDREPFSKTYGSFDRTYWAWKFTDFPGARFQEAVFPLVFFYKRQWCDSELYQNPKVFEWALAGMRNWSLIQYKNGSFDEAYPHEKSLAAASFTAFYVGLAFQELESEMSSKDLSILKQSFWKVGNWLCNNDEKHGFLTNHTAAAAAALLVISKICNEPRFLERSQFFLGKIYAHQNKEEGWYEEYGGADPGYQTHATAYLAWIWNETKDVRLLKSLEESLSFLQYFIHPNGTIGGEYGSRNTEFYYPAGFEILSQVSSTARAIAGFMRSSVVQQRAGGLSQMDAYNFLPVMNSYLLAAQCAEVFNETPKLPFHGVETRDFKDAGISIQSNPSFYLIFGRSKGGILKIFDKKNGHSISDCGYILKIREGGPWLSSQSLYFEKTLKHDHADVPFVQINQTVMNPVIFIGFRLFTITLGRLSWFGYFIKNILVKVLVSRKREFPARLNRHVDIQESKVTVYDRIQIPANVKHTQLKRGAKFSTIHMGSSRYFLPQEVEEKAKEGSWLENQDWNSQLERSGSLEIVKAYQFAHLSSRAPADEVGLKEPGFSKNF